jgi:hypothetical protein
MVFYIVLGLISGTTAYLITRDIKANRRLKNIENAVKTYIKNGKEGQTKAPEKTGDTDRNESTNAPPETTRR